MSAHPAELGRISSGGRPVDSVPVGGRGAEGGRWVCDHEPSDFVVRGGLWPGGRKQSVSTDDNYLKSEPGLGRPGGEA